VIADAVRGQTIEGVRRPTTLGQARYALAVLLAVAVFNHIDRTILSILQVPLKRDLHLSDTALGALTGLSFAGVYCLFAVPMSRVADRVNRKRLMAVSLALWSLTTAASGQATNFLTLVVLRMGLALGESCCSPTTLSLLSDYFPLKKRALPIAVWTMSVPIGTMFGISAGGWLTQSLGWRNAFLCVGLAGVALAPLILTLKEPPRGQFDPNPQGVLGAPPIAAAVRLLWGSRAFRFQLLGGTLQSYVLVAIQMWSAPFYNRVHGMPLGQVGLAVALLFGLGGGVGALLGGVLSQRGARRDTRAFGWTPALAGIALIPFALVQFLSANVALSLASGFVAVVMLNVYLAPFNASTQSLVPPTMRAFTSATLLVFTNLVGLGLGPLVTGALSDWFQSHGEGSGGLRYALCATLPVAFAAALAFTASATHLRRELSEIAIRGAA
jgi:predicted MFS family arabinose efflux permease